MAASGPGAKEKVGVEGLWCSREAPRKGKFTAAQINIFKRALIKTNIVSCDATLTAVAELVSYQRLRSCDNATKTRCAKQGRSRIIRPSPSVYAAFL